MKTRARKLVEFLKKPRWNFKGWKLLFEVCFSKLLYILYIPIVQKHLKKYHDRIQRKKNTIQMWAFEKRLYLNANDGGDSEEKN